MRDTSQNRKFSWATEDALMAPPSWADLDVIMERETVEIVEEGGALSESATQEPATGPPEGEQDQPMETNPASPMSPNEDDLLTGAATAGIEAELASLWVTSLPEGQGGNKEASS